MFQLSGVLNADNARAVLEDGLRAIESGQTVIDLAQLTTVDSAAVATLLAWQRAAGKRRLRLDFNNIPVNLRSLADLYGVAELLKC